MYELKRIKKSVECRRPEDTQQSPQRRALTINMHSRCIYVSIMFELAKVINIIHRCRISQIFNARLVTHSLASTYIYLHVKNSNLCCHLKCSNIKFEHFSYYNTWDTVQQRRFYSLTVLCLLYTLFLLLTNPLRALTAPDSRCARKNEKKVNQFGN